MVNVDGAVCTRLTSQVPCADGLLYLGAVFGYFEILLGSGDLGLITQERVRLQSFEQTMRAVGIDYDIIIDMFDYTWELFDAIKEAIEKGNKNEAVLLDCMNDQPKSDSIVYHFKVGLGNAQGIVLTD